MKKILLLGSGELGKEFTISAKRLGCEVIACDKYANGPAMQVADNSVVFDMLDAKKLANLDSTKTHLCWNCKSRWKKSPHLEEYQH